MMCDGSPGVENERIMETPIVKLRRSRRLHTYDARLRPSGRDVEQLSTTRWVGSRIGNNFYQQLLKGKK